MSGPDVDRPQVRSWQRADLVPLVQRLRYLQRYRAAAVALVLALSLPRPPTVVLVLGAVALVAGAVAAAGVQRSADGARWLFGVVLLGDGLLFTTLVHLSGGLASPTRYLVLLHLVIVTLVASHRTGVKLAIWHSLLTLVVAEAIDIGWLQAVELADPTRALVAHLALVWLVTLVTASASGVNEREILRRRHDLDALARMSSALERVSDLHGVAGALVEHVVQTFDARRAAVVSLRDGDPVPLAGHGLRPMTRAGSLDGVLGEVATHRRTVLQSGLAPVDAWLAGQLPGAERLLFVPLVAGEEVDALLLVEFAAASTERMEQRVVSTIQRFAAQGALALANAHLHNQLVAMAETDGLTGIANRAAFDRSLAAELARVDRQGSEFMLLLCDLDHFKSINDTHGHQVGDDVLVTVAAALRRCSRPYDTVARFGGEEFAVIMPVTTHADPALVAERYRAAVAAAATPVPVTASVGIVSVTAAAAPATVVSAADAALYASKRGGRDRVTAADPVVEPAGMVLR